MSLASDLIRIRDRRNGDIDRVAQDALLVLGQRVITATPVDTGAARGNWLAAYGTVDTSTNESTADRAGQQAIGRLQVEINGFKPGTVFFFTNSLPYIRGLEDGRSDQSPSGMIKTNVADWQGIVARSVSRYK